LGLEGLGINTSDQFSEESKARLEKTKGKGGRNLYRWKLIDNPLLSKSSNCHQIFELNV